jgi:predicted nucleic acid-binding protein
VAEVKALCDTNIVIDLLSGSEKAIRELSLYDELWLSRISWMEILIGAGDQDTETLWEELLSNFSIVDLDLPIAREAIQIRRSRRIKLPDAIIWASSRSVSALLLTRNTKDFPLSDPMIRFPYRI